MKEQITIKARNNGKYIVHFYNNGAEANVNCDSLEYALELASSFLKSVASNSKTEVPAER